MYSSRSRTPPVAIAASYPRAAPPPRGGAGGPADVAARGAWPGLSAAKPPEGAPQKDVCPGPAPGAPAVTPAHRARREPPAPRAPAAVAPPCRSRLGWLPGRLAGARADAPRNPFVERGPPAGAGGPGLRRTAAPRPGPGPP